MKTVLILLAAIADAAAAIESKMSRYTLYQLNSLLPFLDGIKTAGRVEYDDSIRGRNLALAQEQEKIAAWAKKYSRTEQVKKFKSRKDASFEQFVRKVTKVLESLPAAFEEALKIARNGDKTVAEIKKADEMRKKEEALYLLLHHVLHKYSAWVRARPINDSYRRRLAARIGKTSKNGTGKLFNFRMKITVHKPPGLSHKGGSSGHGSIRKMKQFWIGDPRRSWMNPIEQLFLSN